jgi:phage baseplate assembly protein gpV
VDRWTIVGKAGTRIAIIEENSGEAKILLTTPGGVSSELTDSGGGKIEFKAAGTTITVDTSGVTVQTPSKVKVQASQVEVSAGMVKVDAAMSQFSGMVKCDILQTNTVIATTYTPGAGNIW